MKRSRIVAAAGVAALAAGYVLERTMARRWRAGGDQLAAAGLWMPSEVEHHFVPTSDGGRIHAVEAGRGPAIVLMHGFSLGVGVWARQFHGLAGSHRVIALDQRGHGQSIGGAGGYAFERLADDLIEVLGALGVSGAVVVGHSMGGMVLQLAAVRRAEQLARHAVGLVLLATDPGPAIAGPLGRPMGVAAARAGWRAARLAEHRGKGVPGSDLSTWAARASFGARPRPEDVELVRSISMAMSPRALGELMGPLLSFDVRIELPDIALPTLIVVGDRDLLTPPRRARHLAENIPGARLEIIPGCGHLVMLERPRVLNSLVDSFSAELAV